ILCSNFTITVANFTRFLILYIKAVLLFYKQYYFSQQFTVSITSLLVTNETEFAAIEVLALITGLAMFHNHRSAGNNTL
ncbi:hypothetical protein CEN40_03925, partial [Fischerella thermalis CCMEE 5205]